MAVFLHDIHDVRDLRVVKNREIGVKATSEGLLVLILISLHKKDCANPSSLTGRERAGQFISNNESFMRGDIREFGEDMPDELRAGHSHSTDIEGCLEQVEDLCDFHTGLLLYHHLMLDGHAGIRDCDHTKTFFPQFLYHLEPILIHLIPSIMNEILPLGQLHAKCFQR